MKHFLIDGLVHAYEEDGSQDSYIPAGATSITKQQALEISSPPPTAAELQAQYTALLDAHIDAKAKERGYDNRVTCSMRAGYAGPYQAECLAFALWMDACYETGQQVLADVTAGTRQMPTPEAFITELPPMVWPEAAQ